MVVDVLTGNSGELIVNEFLIFGSVDMGINQIGNEGFFYEGRGNDENDIIGNAGGG